MDAVASVTIRRSYSTLIAAMFVFECPFEREQTGAFPVFKYLTMAVGRPKEAQPHCGVDSCGEAAQSQPRSEPPLSR